MNKLTLTNSKRRYGLIAILIHWIMAVMIVGAYFVGDYMVDLNYYDKLYHTLPFWHKSFGVLIFYLLIFRLLWKKFNHKVLPLPHYKKWEISLSRIIHFAFYLLIAITSITGYLISTSKGAPIEVFNLFEVPALFALEGTAVDLLAEIHETASSTIMIFLIIHLLGALKHHFIDKDITLKRIFSPK